VSALITGDTLTSAWLAALGHLVRVDREAFGLVVDIADPVPDRVDSRVVAELDDLLRRTGRQDVATVANTIFPAALASSSRDRQELYRRYRRLLPRLHRFQANQWGLYFERLIDYPLRHDPRSPTNQVENIITALRREMSLPAPRRFIYEAQVFVPGRDRRRGGFPCLSSLSFQLDRDQLRLIATYRNQYYVERALGNFLGLAGLQGYVARETDLRQGPLTVVAFHAEADDSRGDIERLLAACGWSNKLP
jgi:hypothetical protein